MKRVLGFFIVVLLAELSFSLPSYAHTRSVTYSVWQINGASLQLQFTVPDSEALRVTHNGQAVSPSQLGQYIGEHVGAFSVDGACRTTKGPLPISASPGYRRYEFWFECPSATDIEVYSTAWFELVASHTNFAQMHDENGSFTEQLITKDRQKLKISGGDTHELPEDAGFFAFVEMGIMHIFTGIDHMSFMLGLVLISRNVRDLLFVVTGFTLGHSLTLALAVTGILRPDTGYIDALVALTIVLIGAENIGISTGKPLPIAIGLAVLLFLMALAKYFGTPIVLPTLLLIGGAIFTAHYLVLSNYVENARRVRLIMTTVFGLIHGFGFASDLLEMKLPTDKLVQLLIGFNFGVEIGQVTVVLIAVSIAAFLVRLRLSVPRPIFTDIAGAFLVGEGLCWFIVRTIR